VHGHKSTSSIITFSRNTTNSFIINLYIWQHV